jgi:hypothetical protein
MAAANHLAATKICRDSENHDGKTEQAMGRKFPDCGGTNDETIREEIFLDSVILPTTHFGRAI